MLKETHENITFWAYVTSQIAFGKDTFGDTHELALMQKGAIAPDNFMDFPHHHGKNLEIAMSILKARILYLQNDDECYYYLGLALHYIQDKLTLRPRIGDAHTNWESSIAQFAKKQVAKELEGIELDKVLTAIPEKYAYLYRLFANFHASNLLFLAVGRPDYRAQLAAFPVSEENIHWMLISGNNDDVSDREFRKFQSFNAFQEYRMEAEIGLFRFPVEVRIIAFANFGHPSRNWSTSELDFSFALHASRELCLYVLTPNSEKMYSGLESQVDKNRWFERDSLQRSLDYLSETKKSFEKYPSLGKEFYPFLDFLLMDHIVGADEQSKKTYFA